MVLSCSVLLRALACRVALCGMVLSCAVLCYVVVRCVTIWSTVLCRLALCCASLWHRVVSCCVVLGLDGRMAESLVEEAARER